MAGASPDLSSACTASPGLRRDGRSPAARVSSVSCPRAGTPICSRRTAAAPRRPLAGAEAEKRLAELRAELARSERAEKLQYQLDGLQSRLFKAEEALRECARLRDEAQGAETVLAAAGPAASRGLPEGCDHQPASVRFGPGEAGSWAVIGWRSAGRARNGSGSRSLRYLSPRTRLLVCLSSAAPCYRERLATA